MKQKEGGVAYQTVDLTESDHGEGPSTANQISASDTQLTNQESILLDLLT